MIVRRFGEEGLVPRPEASVTVGSYDGVHRGHHELLGRLAAGELPTVVTFEPHPQHVLRRHPDPLKVLTPLPEKLRKLEALGVQRTVVVPFTRETARVGAEDFLVRILLESVGMSRLVVGFNHNFGRNREGDIEFMKDARERHGFELEIVEPVEDEEAISSTRIRNALAAGELARANRWLGEPYRMAARVVSGDGRGRGLGYPTANLEPLEETQLVPAEGVYAVRASLGNGLSFGGVASIGRKETFGESLPLAIEVHAFDADLDLYGRTLWVQWIAFLRGQEAFPDADTLVEQIHRDADEARSILARSEAPGERHS